VTAPPVDRWFLSRLRALSLIEGASTLVLFFVAMPMKYFGGMPRAVTFAGAIHGALFLGLVAMFVVAIDRVPLGRRLALRGIVGAVVPFGPFVVDRSLRRLGDGTA
jgi:integral membrane protein